MFTRRYLSRRLPSAPTATMPPESPFYPPLPPTPIRQRQHVHPHIFFIVNNQSASHGSPRNQSRYTLAHVYDSFHLPGSEHRSPKCTTTDTKRAWPISLPLRSPLFFFVLQDHFNILPCPLGVLVTVPFDTLSSDLSFLIPAPRLFVFCKVYLHLGTTFQSVPFHLMLRSIDVYPLQSDPVIFASHPAAQPS